MVWWVGRKRSAVGPCSSRWQLVVKQRHGVGARITGAIALKIHAVLPSAGPRNIRGRLAGGISRR